MAETLEEKVADTRPEGKKEEKKAPSRWESGWKEIKEGAYAATNSAIATGANYLSWLRHGLDGLILTSSFPIGAAIHKYLRKDGKGELTTKTIRDESLAALIFTELAKYGVAATMAVPAAYGLEGVTDILGASVSTGALAVAGTTFFVLNPLLNLVYKPIQHLIHKKTFTGMWTDIKTDYLKSLKRTWWLNALTAGVMAGVKSGTLSGGLLFPYFAASGLAYRILMSPEPIDYKKLVKALGYTLLSPVYVPYKILQGTVSFAKPVYRSVKGTSQAAYAIGSTFYEKIKGFFSSAAKKASEAVQPQGTPATAGAH